MIAFLIVLYVLCKNNKSEIDDNIYDLCSYIQDKIKYDDIIINGLKVMDTSACTLCKQNHIPIIVFDFEAKDGIVNILNGKEIGTYISEV